MARRSRPSAFIPANEVAHDIEVSFRAALEAMNRHDFDASAEFLAEDVVVVDYSNPAVVYRGRAECRALNRGFLARLPDLTWELRSLVSSGNRLAAELVLHGTPAGQTEPIHVHYCSYCEFRDGMVLSEHLYGEMI